MYKFRKSIYVIHICLMILWSFFLALNRFATVPVIMYVCVAGCFVAFLINDINLMIRFIGEPPTEIVRKKRSTQIFICTAIAVIITSITIWLGLF